MGRREGAKELCQVGKLWWGGDGNTGSPSVTLQEVLSNCEIRYTG